MARSDFLKRLFGAYTLGDDAGFRSIADELIEDERRKRHSLLADELHHALTRDQHRPGARQPVSLRPVPKDRDDRPLLTLIKPLREVQDMVLDAVLNNVVQELVEENRSRSTLAAFALRPRQRLLFIGPPGTGKSMTAHVIASELSLPVATVSLAALTSSYLGETARNVERVVRFADLTPCVLLFDEFDAISSERSGRNDHGELRRVVATVLQLLDNTQSESVLIATSNHPALLDEAVWRRFDEVLTFKHLAVAEVDLLVATKLRAVPTDISTSVWAERLQHLTPADIEAACLDAMRRWVLSGDSKLSDSHLGASLNRVQLRGEAVRHSLESLTSSLCAD